MSVLVRCTQTVSILNALGAAKKIQPNVITEHGMSKQYSDIISDGGMDPRTEYEEARRPDQDTIKEEIWNRFMENMKFVAEHGKEPILPKNFIGSAEKHKVQFMKIDIHDLTK